MQIIGHRGAMGYKPENTISSFKEALRLGANGIELDVWVCRSGELVVFHDETLDKLTNGSGHVYDKTLAELKRLKVKHPIPEKEEFIPHDEIIIPTLDEVLDVVDKRAFVNVELKGPNTARAVYSTIDRYVMENGWPYDGFLVSSFDHPELRKFQKISKGLVNVGYLFSGIPRGYAKSFKKDGAYALHPELDSTETRLATLVKDAHKGRLKVNFWTVNTEEQAAVVARLGADGVFTNYPDRMREWVAKYSAR
ncbi:glycerophosphodiester phosphodiesterase [Candidatus Woesearchaeota archaeon]|nr:glycerophosphodiester phosphodiesterase [Candidatus Woesearchaeota archaeon]